MPSSYPDQEQGEGHRLLGSGSYRSEQDVLSHLSTTSSKKDDPIAAILVASYRSSKHSGNQSGKHSSKDADTNGSAGWFGSALIMSNIILGVGLLNFAAAFRDAGNLVSALSMEVVSVVFIAVALIILAYLSECSGRPTYQAMMEHYLGRAGLWICNVFICIHNFGACVTFLVILADQLDQLMSFTYGDTFCHQWYLARTFTLTMVSTIMVLPFCFPKNIESFKFGSILGLTSMVYVVGLVVAKAIATDTSKVTYRDGPDSWVDVFRVLPTICFSFEGHIESIPVYNSLRKRSVSEFCKAVSLAVGMCMAVYTMVGAAGYMTFGADVKTDLLTAYYPPDATVLIAMAMVGLKAVITYPLVFWCFRLVMMEVTESLCGPNRCERETQRRVGVTVVFFFVSLIIAQCVPSIGSVIALLGGSASLFVFVFPGLCMTMEHVSANTAMDRLRLCIGIFFAVFGVFVAVTTTGTAIIRYRSYEFSGTEVMCV